MDNPITEYHPTSKTGLTYPDGSRIEYNTLEFIVIHHWGDPATNPQFDAVVQGLAVTYDVSANYVCEDRRLAELAAPNILTWHALDANIRSCAIENNPRCSIGDALMCARAIAWIWRFAGRKIPLKKHSDVVATACPGKWGRLVDNGKLYKISEQIYQGKEPKMLTDEDKRQIANAVLDAPLKNAAGNDISLRGMLKAIDTYTGQQPQRVWTHPMKNYLGNDITPQALLYWVDNNQGGQYQLLVEANERTKAMADAVAQVANIDREQIEKTVKEAVDKAMEGFELTLAPKQDKGEANE